MSADRAVMQQALDALEWNKSYLPNGHPTTLSNNAIAALRQALAQPVPDVPETDCGNMQAPAVEPVAIVAVSPNQGATVGWMPGYIAKHNDKLYAAPQPAAPVAPTLAALVELAKVYASSYASPHHITFTVEGLRKLFAAAKGAV